MSPVVLALLLSGSVSASESAPAAPPAPPPVHVRASVDRTAVWVADRVTYTIDIVCAGGVDILIDDLAKEKLRLNGLEVISTEASVTTDASGRTTHRLRYLLTTYRIDMPSLTIEPVSVRYYAKRPGQSLQEAAPAGEVQVPGAAIAFRSTLPENQPAYQLRDGRSPTPRRRLLVRAQQAGFACVVVALVPAAFLVVSAIGRRAARTPRRSKREVRQDHRSTLERLRALDVATEDDRRRAYDEISAAVRRYVAARAHVPGPALTPSELEAALAANGGRVPRESVVALLATCDDARYGSPGALPSAQACRDALTEAEQLLGGH
ncbi:MAG TPA: hypothetical protein VEL79_07630 [Vicinamibacterales bacterium]|nr:hypothetical protein [Vicinamibacterales bacterium]